MEFIDKVNMHKIKRVHLEISTLCNSHCVTCPHDSIARAEMIDAERARNVIREDCLAYKDSIENFEFHNYNEPFLTFDLFYELGCLVNSIYGYNKVGVVTNGSVMSKDMAVRLIKLRLAYIYFSVDGLSKEVFESHRVGLERDRVYANIEYFLDLCETVNMLIKNVYLMPYMSFVITGKNRHEMEPFGQYFRNKYCHISFQDCDGRGMGVGKEVNLNDAFLDQPCDYAMDGVYILTNLDVVPCCLDWSGIEVMGNLAGRTLQEIVDGERYQGFREKQMTGRKREIGLCANCKSNMRYGIPRFKI